MSQLPRREGLVICDSRALTSTDYAKVPRKPFTETWQI